MSGVIRVVKQKRKKALTRKRQLKSLENASLDEMNLKENVKENITGRLGTIGKSVSLDEVSDKTYLEPNRDDEEGDETDFIPVAEEDEMESDDDSDIEKAVKYTQELDQIVSYKDDCCGFKLEGEEKTKCNLPTEQLAVKIMDLEIEKKELLDKVKESEEKLSAMKALGWPLRNLGRSSDLAANKIVELCKKNRELKELLAEAQGRPSKEDQDDKSLLSPTAQSGGGGDSAEMSIFCKTYDELKDLQNKLSQANAKLYESKNQVQHLKQELHKAHKALISETGDNNIDLQTVLSPGWRGRAEQIMTLQQKVNEMQMKLNSGQDREVLLSVSSARLSERSRESELTRQIESLKLELEEANKKIETTRTRIKSLNQQCTQLKLKNESYSNRCDQLQMDLLNSKTELVSIQEKSRDREQASQDRMEQQLELLRKDLSQEKLKNEQLTITISERDLKISSLQNKLFPSFSRRERNSLDRLSNENEAVSQSPKTMDRPLSDVSSSRGFNGAATRFTHEKQDNSQVIITALEAERLRLMELIAVNNRRLEEERDSLEKTRELLRQERHKCARLETKVARLELERVGWSKGLYRKPSVACSIKSISDQSSAGDQLDAMKHRSELLEEKCLALESRLKCLQHEKEEDNQRFLKFIDETRVTYMDQLKNQQS